MEFLLQLFVELLNDNQEQGQVVENKEELELEEVQEEENIFSMMHFH